MSATPKDEFGVRQLVTDFGSWGASDAVRAIPKPGMDTKPIEFLPVSDITLADTSKGKRARSRVTREVEPIRMVGYREPEPIPSLTNGTVDRFLISAGAALKNNPLSQLFINWYNTPTFKPDLDFGATQYAIELRDKGFAGTGVQIDDTTFIAMQKARSKEEADYVLDTRLDLAISGKAMSENIPGTLVGSALPSILGSTLIGGAVAAGGLTGTQAIVTAAAAEGVAEGFAAYQADKNNTYDADTADFLGAGILAGVTAGRVAMRVKGAAKTASKADGIVDDVVDATDDTTRAAKTATEDVLKDATKTTDELAAEVMERVNKSFTEATAEVLTNVKSEFTIPGTKPIDNTGFKYKLSNANFGGTLYRSKGSTLEVNGLKMSFENTQGGLDDLVEDLDDIPKGYVNVDGTPLEGIGGSLSQELEEAILQRNAKAAEVKDDLTKAVEDNPKPQPESAPLPTGELKPMPKVDDTIDLTDTTKVEEKPKPKTKSKPETKKEPKKDPKPEPKVEPRSTPKPTTKPTKTVINMPVKEAQAKANTYNSELDKLNKQIAKLEAKKSKTYYTSQINEIVAQIKELKKDRPNLTRNAKLAVERVAKLQALVNPELIVAATKAVQKAERIVEVFKGKADAKGLKQAESILRDKKAALAKLK